MGANERAAYGVSQVTLTRLDRLMERVFENERVIIYGAGG